MDLGTLLVREVVKKRLKVPLTNAGSSDLDAAEWIAVQQKDPKIRQLLTPPQQEFLRCTFDAFRSEPVASKLSKDRCGTGEGP
jgi:hypothetical protein